MARYIDEKQAVSKLADYVYNVDRVLGSKSLTAEQCTDIAVSVLEEAPTADVVEVVRCRDCKYAEESEEREWLLCHYYGDQWNEENHYCSYGERKPNDN